MGLPVRRGGAVVGYIEEVNTPAGHGWRVVGDPSGRMYGTFAFAAAACADRASTGGTVNMPMTETMRRALERVALESDVAPGGWAASASLGVAGGTLGALRKHGYVDARRLHRMTLYRPTAAGREALGREGG